jgi:hypothetical protein
MDGRPNSISIRLGKKRRLRGPNPIEPFPNPSASVEIGRLIGPYSRLTRVIRQHGYRKEVQPQNYGTVEPWGMLVKPDHDCAATRRWFENKVREKTPRQTITPSRFPLLRKPLSAKLLK